MSALALFSMAFLVVRDVLPWAAFAGRSYRDGATRRIVRFAIASRLASAGALVLQPNVALLFVHEVVSAIAVGLCVVCLFVARRRTEVSSWRYAIMGAALVLEAWWCASFVFVLE